MSNAAAFRQHCYLPIIDCVIAELEARFSDSSSTVMIGIQALTPKHPSFLDYEKIAAFAQLYSSNIEDISHEVYQLKRLLQRAEHEQNALSNVQYIITGMFLRSVQTSLQRSLQIAQYSSCSPGDFCSMRTKFLGS